jgi:hypothetical protein
MFGIEWITALITVLFRIAFAIVNAIILRPAWACVAGNYLHEWLPERFHYIPFWHVVAFLLVLGFAKDAVPSLVSVKQNNE